MKTKTLFYRILHACLMIAIVGNVLMISPSQTVSAKPLAAPYTGCASPSQQSQIPETECEALVAFYNSTNGPTWNYHSGWLQTNMPCYWEWVTCDNQTNVTSLYLPWNQLTGSLPPELGNLTYLTSLDLDYNQLSGPIPPELGSLTTLTSLSVYDNQLSGSIPAELGNLKNLTDLNLMENKLSGPIPSELGGMTNLSDLALNYNQLSGSIPPELGNLANLTGLGLTGNQLSGPIPTELGNLINLNYLYISGNELTGDFPTSITNLVNLHWLEIDECQGLTSSDPAVIAFIGQLVDQDWQCLPRITNVSPIEGGLSGGKSVTITGTDFFTDTSSVTFGGASASFTVNSNTQITAISPAHAAGVVDIVVTNTFGDGSAVGAFTYNRPFAGCASVTQIPTAECNALVALYNSADGANWTHNTGWLQTDSPCIWYGVSCAGGTNVTDLSLDSNHLSGSIAPELGSLRSLTRLDFYDNPLLSGAFPTQLGDLSQLEDLWLEETHLTGEIPTSFAQLTSLESLSLSCGMTSTDPSVISFLDGILGAGWQPVCPPNDDFDHALVIDQLPYTRSQRTKYATTATDDPFYPCGYIDQGVGSVWYRITPANTESVNLDTDGSGYAVVLAVWTGSRGSLVNVACDDTGVVGTFGDSQVKLTLTAGQTYYIEVAGGYQGWQMVFNAVVSDSSDPTPVTPTPVTPTPVTPTPVTPTPVTPTPVPPTPTRTPVVGTQTFVSSAAQDGWILESSETSNKGGTLNAKATTFNLGDDAANRQYRGMLHFNVSLPAGAVITSVTLKIKKSGVVGTNPFNTHGPLLVDIGKPSFGTSAALALGDFQAAAGSSAAASFGKTPAGAWYSAVLNSAAMAFINPAGTIQFRLRFTKDDNNDHGADYMMFFSGNAPAASRPQLVIQYTVP